MWSPVDTRWTARTWLFAYMYLLVDDCTHWPSKDTAVHYNNPLWQGWGHTAAALQTALQVHCGSLVGGVFCNSPTEAKEANRQARTKSLERKYRESALWTSVKHSNLLVTLRHWWALRLPNTISKTHRWYAASRWIHLASPSCVPSWQQKWFSVGFQRRRLQAHCWARGLPVCPSEIAHLCVNSVFKWADVFSRSCLRPSSTIVLLRIRGAM